MLNGDDAWSQVGCKRCFAKGPEFMLNDDKAVAGWNLRATLVAPPETQGVEARCATCGADIRLTHTCFAALVTPSPQEEKKPLRESVEIALAHLMLDAFASPKEGKR